jgi:hypothetical protein
VRKILLALFLISLCWVVFLASKIQAGVTINEISPASSPEWIEIYNPDDSDFSLNEVSVYFDVSSTSQKINFCSSDKIVGKSFKKLTLSSNWLANTGDTLILKFGDDEVETISYGTGGLFKSPLATQSASRTDTGWVVGVPTPQGEEVNLNCPSPTPTPTPTPIPTPVPAGGVYRINDVKDNAGNVLNSVQIYLDDVYIHHYPPEVLTFCDSCDYKFGSHTISLKKSGYDDWSETKNISSGSNFEVNPIMRAIIQPTPTPSPAPTPTPNPSPTPVSTPVLKPTFFEEILGTKSSEIDIKTEPTPINLLLNTAKKDLSSPILIAVGGILTFLSVLSIVIVKYQSGS